MDETADLARLSGDHVYSFWIGCAVLENICSNWGLMLGKVELPECEMGPIYDNFERLLPDQIVG